MQFSPLQSRLAAPLLTTPRLLLLLHLVVLFLGSAQAVEASGSRIYSPNKGELHDAINKEYGPRLPYPFDLAGLDASLIKRAPPGITGLLNNVRENRNVRPGETQHFVFEAIHIFGADDEDGENTNDGDGATDSIQARDHGNETLVYDLNGPDDKVRLGKPKPAPSLQRRQRNPKTVYISATTCMQPQRKNNNTSVDPPQISLFVSTSEDIQKPGPDTPRSGRLFEAFDEGAVKLSVNASGDVFFSISAPMRNDEMFEGDWNFDVAVSTDMFFHSYEVTSGGLLWVDSDSSAAVLTTRNLTDTYDPEEVQQIMDGGPQYVMFVDSEDGWATRGIRHSMCGLSQYAPMSAKVAGPFGDKATTFLTTRGPGGLPKQQFHFTNLDPKSTYLGILAYTGTETLKRQLSNRAGGGGQIFQATQFETKEGDNCKIITNLDFCNETEYAVPANDNRFTVSQLAQFYDEMARDKYRYFERQLAQVACEAPQEQRYSLVRNCTDCAVAYKKWLCSVLIPRCEDFSSENTFYLVRNVNQSFPNGTRLPDSVISQFPGSKHQHSRHARIDEEVQPGPYREVLPCEDLCYDLVRNCPSSLQFSCPRPQQAMFNASYQVRGSGLTCNFPGSVHNPSGSSVLSTSWTLFYMAALAGIGMISL
ncbi:calcium influx-promoting protein ehs1 [Sodiomyces alkalinus F11]|uniref:Calcium influx-promoting protein ehs1 n=1 Tax=Sodiomyces alkalinus (strain CBS 110278 / VKM F-3762 / F11) TaxID=1314773 RepID=A0A3N2Q8L5_SODAK|nr:calcium influx-promoting protein ehs1 [Sodiomyces alkalinus F11]ROT43114.1 calcium influx-promoting protein ehs1 [Sodiomyces alkalinus F11]